MALIIFNIFNWFAFAIGLPWMIIMFPVVRWYHTIGEKHLAKTVSNEGIRLVA